MACIYKARTLHTFIIIFIAFVTRAMQSNKIDVTFNYVLAWVSETCPILEKLGIQGLSPKHLHSHTIAKRKQSPLRYSYQKVAVLLLIIRRLTFSAATPVRSDRNVKYFQLCYARRKIKNNLFRMHLRILKKVN